MRSMPPSVASHAAMVALARASPATAPARGVARKAQASISAAMRPTPEVMPALSRSKRGETRQRAGKHRLPGPSFETSLQRLGVLVLEFRHGLQAVLGGAAHDDLVDLALVVGIDDQLVIGHCHEMVAHAEEA